MPKAETEQKEQIPDIDAAFDDEQSTSEVEDAEAQTTETAGQTPAKEKGSESESTAEVEQKQDVVEQDKDEWTKAGMPEFSGKSPDDIAKILKQRYAEDEHRRQVLGRQAQELGEIRKRMDEFEQARTAPEQAQKKDVTITPLSEQELDDFNELWAQHPGAALQKYASNVFKEIVQQALSEQLAGNGAIGQHIRRNTEAVQQEIAWNNLCAKAPDAPQYIPKMRVLDDPQNLGQQARSTDELYALAKLHDEDKPLYEAVYVLCKKHPTLSVEEAKRFASQQVHGQEAAEAKKRQLAAKVQKVDIANNTAVGRKAAQEKVMTIDEAFDEDS